MPSPYVKQLAKETGKSSEEIEVLWNKAKELSKDSFGTAEEEWGEKEYSYTVGIVKNMLGINESLSAIKFINSDLSAKEFIEQATVVSADFSLDNLTTKKDPEDDEEKKDELEGSGKILNLETSKEIKKISPQLAVLVEHNKKRPLPEGYAKGEKDPKYFEDICNWEEEWEKLNASYVPECDISL